MIIHKRKTPKRFSYEPRFYNPEKDEGLKRRMEVGRKAHRRRGGKSNLITLFFLCAFALYIYIVLI